MIVPALGAALGQLAFKTLNSSQNKMSEDLMGSATRTLAELSQFLVRANRVLEQLEPMMPRASQPDWTSGVAFRWRRRPTGFGIQGFLQPVRTVSHIRLGDLKTIDQQKEEIERNTRQFVEGLPANNVLLTGSRGTGKSSLIKACLNEYAKAGLRLIEVDKEDLVDLPDIVELVADRPERFIIFADDLSFEQGEAGYKALKTALDGSIAAQSDNVLIYATSNRRHLMPEQMSENLQYKHQEDGEIHPGETTEEKISLSERFGLWVNFYPFHQDDYLAVCAHWLRDLGASQAQLEGAHGDALRFALERGSRSGRVAWQFAKDWAGQHGIRKGASAAGAGVGAVAGNGAGPGARKGKASRKVVMSKVGARSSSKSTDRQNGSVARKAAGKPAAKKTLKPLR